MNYTTMDQEDIRKILSKHASCMTEVRRIDDDVRAQISAQTCTTCSTPLVPRPVQNLKNLFNGVRIRYESWCPSCKVVNE